MDKILKALHLRLDSTSKSLTKNAISQLIIKILFQHISPITFSQIEEDLKSVLGTKIDSERIEKGIEKLLDKNEINFSKKRYSLTRSNRKTLDGRYTESQSRLNRIIEKYFQPFNSRKEVVIEWFSDATIEFFKSYSVEWISDLCYTKSEKLKTKKENIFKKIERRTKNNKELEKEDHAKLVETFIECLIHKKDPDLDALLWEYGTSAFAASLLQSSIGADPISINAFRGSKCVLDTNVLMNIGLEASEYHLAIKKLDKIFAELNIQPGYFHITEQEYVNTVANKREEILRTASKFSYDVIKETDDHFIQSAVKRQCHLYEDFETFCKEILTPPNKLDQEQGIAIFNNDPELDKVIEEAQKDETKKDQLNNLYKEITGKDKRENPLVHDVGLIAGIEYYRKTSKSFILSQELSINSYSHSKPIKDNLPLAIKLETLINMLAIDNGGTAVNPTDFSNLFAQMIRFNLQPDKNTFEITDLSKMLDVELQIEQLPPEEVIRMANKLHQNRTKGLSDEEVNLELNRDFQEVKLKFVDDFDTAKEELSYERSQNKKNRVQLSKTEEALKNRIRREEIRSYDRKVLFSRIIWFLIIPLAVTSLALLAVYILQQETSQSAFENYIITIAVSVLLWILTSFGVTKPRLAKLNETRKAQIEIQVEERFSKEIV